MNPYVFIVGCPRSGTTLLQRMVNAHRRIAVMPEAPWIYQLFEQGTGIDPAGTVKDDLIRALLKHPKFAPLRIAEDQLLSLIGDDQPATYSEYIQKIFDLYGKMRGKKLVGNKTPGLVRRLEALNNLWSRARIIHVIRDGRDIFLSMKNRPLRDWRPGVQGGWSEDPVLRAALWWELNVRMGRKAGKMLGSVLYLEIRYESLVLHPAQECRAICAFLGLPYDGAMLHFHEAFARKNKNGWEKHDRQPITPGLRNWRTEMLAEEVEPFEAAAGTLLNELGYARYFPHPALELVEDSARRRTLLSGESARYARVFEGAVGHD
jgi:sulfotransferase family protein